MATVTFFERPASNGWEAVPIPGVDGVYCWTWFKPQHLPTGIAVAIPPEIVGEVNTPLPFSMFHLVHGVGLPWESLASVSLYGGEWQPAALWHNMAGQFLPAPADPAHAQILLMAQNTMPAVPETHPMTSPPATDARLMASKASTSQLSRLKNDWKACHGLERHLSGLRQQMSGVLSRLGSLDRDLSPEENLAADSLVRNEWQDARRWIREASSKLHRCIKAHDIGVTSTAGRRSTIQQMYEQTSVNTSEVGDLTTCLHEVELYLRELTNLLSSINTALQGANANGIQRAQRILSKIASQARQKRAKDRGKS